MNIEILGNTSFETIELEKHLIKALEKLGKPVKYTKTADIKDFSKYGVIEIPALVIDGKLKFEGHVYSTEELIEKYLRKGE